MSVAYSEGTKGGRERTEGKKSWLEGKGMRGEEKTSARNEGMSEGSHEGRKEGRNERRRGNIYKVNYYTF